MIKNFLELNADEKKKALEFISKNNKTYKSLGEFESEVNNKICNYGEGIIFYFESNEVKGKISVILELAKKLKTIYINKMICPSKDLKIIGELIDKAKGIARKYDANKISLGIRDEDLLASIEELGMLRSYSSYNMILKKRNIKYNGLDKVKLSTYNIKEYVDIYNKSFMDMPHGTFIEIEDAKEYLDNKDINEEYFIIVNDNKNIGFLNTTIRENKGFFDIGLIKEYRGKGYGKRLLETAIIFLNDVNVKNICLTVIESNNIAFEMYKKRGFEVYEKLSDWIEVDL